jgi:hypothetical protein
MLTILFVTTAAICAVGLITALRNQHGAPVFIITLSYCLFQMIIPGWVQHYGGSYQWAVKTIDNTEAEGVIAMILLFVVAFGATYTVLQRRYQCFRDYSAIDTSRSSWREGRYLLMTSLASVVTACLALILVGPATLMGTRQDISNSSIGEDGLAFYGMAVLMPRAAASVLVIALFGMHRAALFLLRRSPLAAIVIVGSAILLNTIVLWPTAQPRVILFGVAFGAVCALLYNRKLLVNVLCALLVPIGIYTILPIFGNFNRGLVLGKLQSVSVADVLVSPDYSCFEFLAHSIHRASSEGVLYGMNIVSSVTFFVPRSIFLLKLEHSGQIVAEHVGLSFHNVAVPLIAEGYLAAGWFGVICVAIAAGVIAAKTDRLFVIDESAIAKVAVAVVAGFWLYILRGSLSPAMALVVPQLVLSVVIWKLSGVRTRGSSPVKQ